MDAAGSARFDGFGFPAHRRLEFGQVGHWHTPADQALDERAPDMVAVEFDPGDGSSMVVFVQAPNRRDIPGDFHPDDQVCLVLPDAITALLPTAVKHVTA
ncbi:hypothetical protein [Nocardia arthritidis]|uniref:hypothetical protein n=1 Tax=Nocardia arthritidis TaxID=228602 RepID=UPI00142E2D53|nr:hypothetical protein [Nocardia arthritidis]